MIYHVINLICGYVIFFFICIMYIVFQITIVISHSIPDDLYYRLKVKHPVTDSYCIRHHNNIHLIKKYST